MRVDCELDDSESVVVDMSLGNLWDMIGDE